jgi:hypothetical protein
MENLDTKVSAFGFAFSAKMKEDLRTAAGWAQIVAITGFVTSALVLVTNLVAERFLQAIFSAVINVLINVYLLRFAQQTKRGIENIDQNDMEAGANQLSLYFKVYGIIMVALSGILLLVFLSALVYANRF